MPIRSTTLFAVAALTGAAALAAAPQAARAQDAGTADITTMSADVINLDGEPVGVVEFSKTPSGITHIAVKLEGMPPGAHGFHVHETGVCDATDGFKSAGGHYAGGKKHGILVEGGPHPGDLPNIHVAKDGILVQQLFTDQLTVGSDGENPLADEDGSAIMIHSGPDDYQSQPAGNAGERIACGVIR